MIRRSFRASSRRPSERTVPASSHRPGDTCFVCGAPISVGDRVLGRDYDVRRSCLTCPWPETAVAEATR